jgi:hypothetical protein
MAAVQITEIEEFRGLEDQPFLRLVSTPAPLRPLRAGRSLAERRVARARMMRRRRRTLVVLALVAGLVILSLPGHAFGGVTGGGLSTDLATSSVLASGMTYVVQPGDTVHSIAAAMNPVSPSTAQRILVHELGTSVVVPGEHVLIP